MRSARKTCCKLLPTQQTWFETAVGAASDASFLIDFLPGLPISLWGAGSSWVDVIWHKPRSPLGGHSAWIALRDGWNASIPCKLSALALRSRAQASGLAAAPPRFPASFMDWVKTRDPSSAAGSSHDPSQSIYWQAHSCAFGRRRSARTLVCK